MSNIVLISVFVAQLGYKWLRIYTFVYSVDVKSTPVYACFGQMTKNAEKCDIYAKRRQKAYIRAVGTPF